MNIIPPVPTPIAFNTGTVNTEAVRRENTQRETVPATTALENSAAETGLGSESDRVKTPGQNPQPVVYERPQPQAGQPPDTSDGANQDNAEDESAGKESAEQRQKEQAEQQELDELKKRDLEVRAHEQAHAAVGGQYAGAPQYEYERGPDGRQYAVGGEVSIDVSEASTPEETLRKAQQVKAAALAPAEPSAQDLRVAQEATQLALDARTDIANEKAEEAQKAFDEVISSSQPGTAEGTPKNSSPDAIQAPDLDDIVDSIDVSGPTRTLDNSGNAATNFDQQAASQFLADRNPNITRRVSVIENFYQQVGNPRAEGLQLSA